MSAQVLYTYAARAPGEVSVTAGETVSVGNSSDPSWWTITTAAGKTGLAPANYLQLAAAEPPAASLGTYTCLHDYTASKSDELGCATLCVPHMQAGGGRSGQRVQARWRVAVRHDERRQRLVPRIVRGGSSCDPVAPSAPQGQGARLGITNGSGFSRVQNGRQHAAARRHGSHAAECPGRGERRGAAGVGVHACGLHPAAAA